MRRLRDGVLCVALAACGNKASEPAATSAGSGSSTSPGSGSAVAAAPADAAGPPWIELLHNSPSKIRVSSQVANKTIKPEHLVDRDFNTAWNSRTDDLVGAWIDVMVPAGATIEELRLTVGHTGKGPKGEDYFTMNPRITMVSVIAGDKPLGKFKLDPARRELQPVRVHGTGTLRVRVERIVAGTKKRWREICVSELEAWGTLPAGSKPAPGTPPVEVDHPIVPEPDATDPCAGIEQAKAEWDARIQAGREMCAKVEDPEEREHCGVDEPGPPICSYDHVTITGSKPPWQDVTILCQSSDEVYDKEPCVTTIVTKTDSIDASDDLTVLTASVEDVIPGGAPELVLHLPDNMASVCRTKPKLACSEPLAAKGGIDPTKLVFR